MDGGLKLHHDGLSNTFQQGLKDTTPAAESGKGDSRINTPDAGDFGPELFTDLGTTEVSFGRDVELPPTRRKDEDNKIS